MEDQSSVPPTPPYVCDPSPVGAAANPSTSVTTSAEELVAELSWYELVWDSIATPPADDPGGVLMEE